MLQAERPDDGEGHFLHAKPYRHAFKASLEELIHKCSVDDVVHVMAEGNLVATQLLGKIEDLFAALP